MPKKKKAPQQPFRHELLDGTVYVVQPNGAWKRITKRLCEVRAENNDLHNNGARRRNRKVA